MAFKRFIVFSWSEYDNPEPFQCVDGDFNELKSAIDLAKQSDHSCIFDREDGRIMDIMPETKQNYYYPTEYSDK